MIPVTEDAVNRCSRTTKLSDHWPTVTLGGKENMEQPESNEAAERASGSLERMVRRLYETRQAASEAKKARAELAAKLGNCVGDLPEDSACYHSRKPKDHWCEICKAKLPVWEDYQRKATAAGAALRDVIRAGKRMTPNE